MTQSTHDFIRQCIEDNMASGILPQGYLEAGLGQAPVPAPSMPQQEVHELHPDPRLAIPQPGPEAPQAAPQRPEEKPAARRGRPRKGDRPFLLSTADTLKQFDILYYEGTDYTLDARKHAEYGYRNVARVFSYVFYDIIIPNALVAKDMGFRVSFTDFKCALKYAMTNGRREKSRDAWKDFMTRTEGVAVKPADRISRTFNWYVYDLAWNDREQKLAERPLPPEDRWTLRRYLEDTPAGRFTRSWPRFMPASTKSLNTLINAFADDRVVATMTTEGMMEEYGVSKKTVTRFRKWLSQRREAGVPDEFIVLRR